MYGLGVTLWECATGKNWGAPRVKQGRFEERVDQRLNELPEAYRDIIPVLEQALQWDPRLRPDGGVVERALLHAADQSSGQGLRTWAREVIPSIMKEKRKNTDADDWVGLTLQISAHGEEQQNTLYQQVNLDLLETQEVHDPASTFAASKMSEKQMGPKQEVAVSEGYSAEVRPPKQIPKVAASTAQRDKKGQSSMTRMYAVMLGILLGLIVLCVVVICVVICLLLMVALG